MNSLIGLDAVSITAIAIITAVIIMNKCSANPIAVRTESIEKTRSSTTICAITPEKLPTPHSEVFSGSPLTVTLISLLDL